MAAKVSELAQEVLAKAVGLSPDERALVASKLFEMSPRKGPTVADRHEVIAERIRRVHAGEVATLTLDEVERSLREELDF